MTAFTARRRAEEFDSLVEGISTGRSDARYDEFLAIVGALRDVPTPEPRPEFVTSLRERLMTAAATELLPVDDEAKLRLPARKPARERRLAVAVGGLAIVGATTSMAVAAQSALPGDALYPLKRAIENAQTGFSTDEADKGSHLLANASGRLDEVSELSREGDLKDNVVIASTLNTFTEQATEASDLLLADYASTGDESSIEELRNFTSSSMAQLGELEEAVPPGARDELIHAARVLSQIDSAAASACPTCAGGITELPTILTSSNTIGDLGAAAETATQNGGKNGGKRRPAGRGRPPEHRRLAPAGQRAEPVHRRRHVDLRHPEHAQPAPQPAGRPHRRTARRRRLAADVEQPARDPGPPAPGRRGDARGPHRPAPRRR